jgi:hypothetical protein
MIEKVLSVKCQVLSRASRAGSLCGSPASNFTLYTSNSAEGRSCKTNPIARSGAPRRCPATPGATRPGGRGARGKCAKRTQFPAGPGGTGANGCCTNKPNPCRYADPEIGVPGRANAQNEAKLRQAGIPGGWRAREVAIVRNEPNLAGPPAPRRAKCAKRTQLGPASGRGIPTIPRFQHSNPMPIVQNEPNFRQGRAG